VPDRHGFIDPAGTIRAFERLHVTHSFRSEGDMEEFIKIVDPHSGGMLDPVEMEKAVECVQKDQRRRWPSRGVDEVRSSSTSPLGEEARRLSNQPIQFGSTNADADGGRRSSFDSASGLNPGGCEVTNAAFGEAAFTETLLFLGMKHMHGDRAVIKASAPGGVRGLWLIAFLHHSYQNLVDAHNEAKAAAAARGRAPDQRHLARKSVGAASGWILPPLSPTTSEASTRPQTREASVVPPTRNSSGPQGLTSMIGQQGADAESESQKAPAAEEKMPSGARYSPLLERFLDDNPDLFSPTALAGGRRSACSSCGREPENGWGNMFCHGCSEVDEGVLHDSILYPIFERRRLTAELPELRALDSKVEKPVPAGSNSARSSNAGSGSVSKAQDGGSLPSASPKASHTRSNSVQGL